jgi:hypothetical protein
MREAQMRGLRAYLILAELGVVCPDCGDTALTPNALAPIKNSILLRIENSGQTPARGVVGVINLHSEPEKGAKLPTNFAFPDDQKHLFISKSDIGKDKHRDAIVALANDDITAFKDAAADRATLFLYGHVDYCDIFQQPHTTAYCFKYVLNGGLNLPLCETYNGRVTPRRSC